MLYQSPTVRGARIFTNTSLLSSPSPRLGSVSLNGLKYANSKHKTSLTNLQVLFGLKAYQSSTQLFIDKTSLTNLSVSTNNTAESLLVALLLRLLYLNNSISRVNLSLWGSAINATKIKTYYELELLDNLTVLDTYEIQQLNNIVNPNNY
ncbi:hypothetical protein DSM106972_015960 [Dulcicalothrix desertica PCC 7102]|uniref:Uncharacterized protein n=2 Tax=Dulcicalothrix desertica TaxID=32056 RepID=A0A3S1J646_9CYAN|nr:hypothetical protein [Dulcicalothrix desertica]RUT08428.1 hypothetical protein DSM106972_015960 [Dulcicalothrix desertica PCC 7102]TWH40293.1 hypothetical protein CAL7102_09600 [Dulcicalothrix desertica PCC 7102]